MTDPQPIGGMTAEERGWIGVDLDGTLAERWNSRKGRRYGCISTAFRINVVRTLGDASYLKPDESNLPPHPPRRGRKKND